MSFTFIHFRSLTREDVVVSVACKLNNIEPVFVKMQLRYGYLRLIVSRLAKIVQVPASRERYCAIDGRLPEMPAELPQSLSPIVAA